MQNLGQHFLRNSSVLRKIALAVPIKSGETIIEIGPGHGELTKFLFEQVAEQKSSSRSPVVLIEKDRRLAAQLLDSFPRAEVADGDVLEILPRLVRDRKLRTGGYQLVGNIPYYITGHLLRTIGCLKSRPRSCVFLVQKEVAERIAAQPPRMNRLAASVQIWAHPQALFSVPRRDFIPPPRVDSAVIRLELLPKPLIASAEAADSILRILFAQPRKTVLNNLRTHLPSREVLDRFFEREGLDPRVRPQNLSLQQIASIGKLIR